MTTETPLNLKIREIEFRTHAHATESIEKVKICLKKILPADFKDSDFDMQNLAGTYGNPIRAIIAKVDTQASIKSVLDALSKNITSETKTILNQEFENRLDEKFRFYFRLDKQLLTLNKVETTNDSDVVRITIAFQNKNPKSKPTVDDFRKILQDFQLL